MFSARISSAWPSNSAATREGRGMDVHRRGDRGASNQSLRGKTWARSPMKTIEHGGHSISGKEDSIEWGGDKLTCDLLGAQ